MSSKKEPGKKAITPQQVPENDAKRILKFLNTVKSASEIASAIEIPGERDVGLRVARNILKERTKLGEFTSLKQLADTPQVGPERFSEIVLSLDKLKTKEGKLVMKNTVKLVLDLSQIQEDPELKEKFQMEEKPLKIAAVRDGKILTSFEVDIGKIRDLSSIPVQIDFDYPSEKPPGVYIMIGPNVSEREFLGIETKRIWVPPKKFVESTADLTKDKVIIHQYLFRRWLILCRTFTITGKVVRRVKTATGYCDAPVPGATVDAFDVDCWWFWWKRDKVGTTITKPDGTFEIKFKWCCILWYPLLKPIWVINPDLLKYITKAVKPIVGPIPQEALKSPVQFEEFLEKVSGTPVPIPIPCPESAEPVTERFMASSSPSATSEYTAVIPKTPDITLPYSTIIKELIPQLKPIYPAFPCWPFRPKDCAPDIIFLVKQECKGTVHAVVYEDIFDTRWNIPTSLNVTLFANEKACFVSCEEPPPGDCLKFNWVNCCHVNNIGTSSGPPDLRGYYNPGNGDNPFAGTIRVRGLFGAGSDVDYFKIQYSHDDGPFKDMPEDKLVGFSRAYYAPPPGSPPLTPSKYNSVPFNPQLVDGRIVYKTVKKAEEENPLPGWWPWGRLWDDIDTLFRWNSSGFPEGDGLYIMRLVGYEWNDKTKKLVNEQVMKTCELKPSKEERVMVRIDNRNPNDPIYESTEDRPCGAGTIHLCTYEPDCDFKELIHVKNDSSGVKTSTPIGPCDIIELSKDDEVVIHFNASDKDGHLLGYQMTAHWGENKVFNVLASGTLEPDPDVLVGPSYAKTFSGVQGVHRTTLPATNPEHDRPCWFGGNYKVTVKGDKFETCAYTLRLRVWKRTIEHCIDPYHVHANWCSYSFTIKKV